MATFLIFTQFMVKSYFLEIDILFELPYEVSAFPADMKSVTGTLMLSQ